MAATSETQRVKEAIDKALATIGNELPRAPHVIDARFELADDSMNAPAVYVTVLLDDDTRDEDWTLKNLEPIEDCIRGALESAEIQRWPYVQFARPRDEQESDGVPG